MECHFVWQIFKNLFEEALEIQKERLQELKVYAKDKRAEQKRQHQVELESMENYYKDQVGFFLPTTEMQLNLLSQVTFLVLCLVFNAG